MRYKHTNLVASDWRKLAHFYQAVFKCEPVPPQRNLSGRWLDDGTGLVGAVIQGIHLRLPGGGANGPTLEIFQYRHSEPRPPPRANRKGFGHIAFEVDEVAAVLRAVITHGGGTMGKVSTHRVDGVGLLTYVYVNDPEGNIIELQHWA
jgi:catechol 2,3-dioxygenase-like lactoylglutathione lyase family enzyme